MATELQSLTTHFDRGPGSVLDFAGWTLQVGPRYCASDWLGAIDFGPFDIDHTHYKWFRRWASGATMESSSYHSCLVSVSNAESEKEKRYTYKTHHDDVRKARGKRDAAYLQTWPVMRTFPEGAPEEMNDVGVAGTDGCSGCSLSRIGRESSKE